MPRSWGALGAAGAEFNLSDVVNNVVIIAVGGYEMGVPTMHGERNAVRAACVVLTGENVGLVVSDMLIFNSKVVSRLKGSVGQILTVGVVWGQGRGANAPLDLVEVGPEEYALADAWENDNPGVLDQLLASTIAEHQQQMGSGAAQAQGRQQQNPRGSWQQGGQPNQPNQRQGWGNQAPQQNQGSWQRGAQPQGNGGSRWGGQQTPLPNTAAAAQNRPQQTASWGQPQQSEEPPF